MGCFKSIYEMRTRTHKLESTHKISHNSQTDHELLILKIVSVDTTIFMKNYPKNRFSVLKCGDENHPSRLLGSIPISASFDATQYLCLWMQQTLNDYQYRSSNKISV